MRVRSPPRDKATLERALHETKKSAYASGTIRDLLCHWRSFLRFSRKYKIAEWPVSEHTMCLFAQYLAYTFKSIHSIKNYLQGIKTLHVLARVSPPDMKDMEVNLTIRGLCKILGKQIKQARPLTPEILTDILAYLNMSKKWDRVFWALILVGFFGMLRKSNLIPDTKETFDHRKQLTRGHVSFRGDIAILKITWAKNLQYRQRVVEVPLFPVPGSPLCPVTALRTLLNQEGKSNYPLFGIGRHVAFTYNQFQRKLRKVLKKAGYRSRLFSSHSMCRGGAVFAHCSGAPPSLIQVHGDWQLDCFKRYLTFPIEIRVIVSLKMRQKLLKTGF